MRVEQKPDEQVNFKLPADFKLEVDLEVKRRRSTLRREFTLGIAERFGLPIPSGTEEVEQ